MQVMARLAPRRALLAMTPLRRLFQPGLSLGCAPFARRLDISGTHLIEERPWFPNQLICNREFSLSDLLTFSLLDRRTEIQR